MTPLGLLAHVLSRLSICRARPCARRLLSLPLAISPCKSPGYLRESAAYSSIGFRNRYVYLVGLPALSDLVLILVYCWKPSVYPSPQVRPHEISTSPARARDRLSRDGITDHTR